MAFTKITAAGIGSTETVTLDGLSVINDGSFGGNVSIAGTLTYEDVTNVDSVGIITARSNVLVGSGITLSPDGNIFFTGIMTGNGSGLTGVANTDVIFTDKITLPDSSAGSINVGLASDLQIYHNGSDSVIHGGGGSTQLKLRAPILHITNEANSETLAKFTQDGAVELRYDNSKKFETTGSGVIVTGVCTATSFSGDGSNLTGIEVGLTTASAQVSGITTVIDLSKDDIRLDCTGLVTVDAKGGTEGGSHSLRIVNSGIATVTFNSYFKFPSGGAPNLPTASGAISLISFTVHTQGRVGVASVFLAGSSVNFS